MQPYAIVLRLPEWEPCNQPGDDPRGGIMSDLEFQPVAEPAPAGSGLSQMQRVTSIFSAPSKTFEDIKRGNRSWWMPWVIMAVVGYLFFAAVTTKVGMQTVVDNQSKLMSESQQEKMAQMPP